MRTVPLKTQTGPDYSAGWHTLTISNAKYLVIYSDTHASDALLCYVDLDTSAASGVSSTNSQFQVTINANGIFTLA